MRAVVISLRTVPLRHRQWQYGALSRDELALDDS